MKSRNRIFIAEALEARRLLSANLALVGTQTIAPTAAQTLDPGGPYAGRDEAEMTTAIDPANPLNMAAVSLNYAFDLNEY